MFTKFILPLMAICGIGYGAFVVIQMQQQPPPAKPLIPPAQRPSQYRVVAGAGLVEAQRRNIPIGTPVPGVIDQVFVKEGDLAKPGDKLFHIDESELQAELGVRTAMHTSAVAELEKLRAGYRDEDREISKAALDVAQAHYLNAEVQFKRQAGIYERGAGVLSDFDRDRYARDEAYSALVKARTEYEKVQNGTWIMDIKVAEAAVARAAAEMRAIEVDIARRTVVAREGGQVLQVNVLPGQFAALAWKEPLIVLGDVTKLHVRVDIDEHDLPFFKKGANSKAVGTLKSRPGVEFELSFVRVDPYVIPKKNLTGDNVERVDTRVLQVIYALPDERPVDVYVGQQMDVFLEAAEPVGLDLEMSTKLPRSFDKPANEERGKENAEPPSKSSGPVHGLEASTNR